MAQSDPRTPQSNRPPNNNGGDPTFNWRGVVLFAVAILMLGGAYFFNKTGAGVGGVKDVPYPIFIKNLEAGKIDKDKGLDLISEPGSVNDYLTGTMTGEGTPVRFRTQVNLQFNPYLSSKIESFGIPVTPKSDSSLWTSALLNIFCLLYTSPSPRD